MRDLYHKCISVRYMFCCQIHAWFFDSLQDTPVNIPTYKHFLVYITITYHVYLIPKWIIFFPSLTSEIIIINMYSREYYSKTSWHAFDPLVAYSSLLKFHSSFQIHMRMGPSLKKSRFLERIFRLYFFYLYLCNFSVWKCQTFPNAIVNIGEQSIVSSSDPSSLNYIKHNVTIPT